MQIQPNAIVRNKVTVAVAIFVLFNLIVSSALASEKESSIETRSTSRSAEEGGSIPANDNDKFIRTSGELNALVYKNLGLVREKVGKNWEVNFNSVECQSMFVRDSVAGTCLILANSKTSSDSHALYAILIGEADENGGMMIRKIEFLKQSN